MLTRRSIKYISIFIFLFICGLLLGNRILLIMSLIPFSLLVLGLSVNSPQLFDIKAGGIPGRVWVGDIIQIQYRITVSGGMGLFTLHQFLPPHFSLESGNNLRTYWKGWRPVQIDYSYKIRCTKRGNYVLQPPTYSSQHIVSLKPPLEESVGCSQALAVHPKISCIKNMRGRHGDVYTNYSANDIAKIGVTTTDFREIRQYHTGEAVKNINWRATARLTSPDLRPLINEYEVESKKSVWIFLDASKILEVGTEIENAFEYSLEAANAVLYHYLNRGYMLGMYVFNNQGQLFYPDTGKKQFIKVSRKLLDLNAGNRYDEFPLAVKKCRKFILGYGPRCVIVTRLDNRFSDHIVNGVRLIRLMHCGGNHRLPVTVINIPGYSMISGKGEFDENAALLMQLTTRPKIQQLRALGADVLNWNPLTENINILLHKIQR